MNSRGTLNWSRGLLMIAFLIGGARLAMAKDRKTMTLEEARARLPARQLPSFWVGDVAGLDVRWKKLQRGLVTVIARSPGGRPMHLVAFGEREPASRRANFNSAVGGHDPSAYANKAIRKKPVILFVGPVHGHEVEALTGLVNLIYIMETGADLRGKPQSELRALGDRCRLLIIPAANPDGIARFEPRSLDGMESADLRFWGQGTWTDGSFCGWPECKRRHPMTGKDTGFLGCYFNNAGINPMHDEFLNPMGPEALAILKVAQEEAPDLAVSLHSHESAPALLRPAFVPLEIQEDVRNLAETCYELLEQRGLPNGRVWQPRAESGNPPAPFNLTSALYHMSGARAFTFECPHGLKGSKACQVSLEQILDVQLALYEAMLKHEVSRQASFLGVLTCSRSETVENKDDNSKPTLELSGSPCSEPGRFGCIGVEIRASWMEGHLTLRMPETLASSLGLHFIDHKRVDMPPLSLPNPYPVWQCDPATGAISYEIATPEGVVYGGRARSEGDTVHLEFRVKNETGKTMRNVNNQQCLVMTGAPQFGRRNTLDTTYTWINGRWTCLNATTPTAAEKGRDPWVLIRAKEFARHYAGPLEYPDGWWVLDQLADEYLIARVSGDGRHLLAITWDETPMQMMSNATIPCLHAGPMTNADIEPGQEHTWRGRIYLTDNGPKRLLDMYRRDKKNAK